MAKLKWGLIVGAILAAGALLLCLAPQKPMLTIGGTLPELRFKDLDGNDFFINRTRGKVLLLNFWATWCTYCKEELPYLEEIAKERASDGLVISSVLKDTNNVDLARRIRDDSALTFPIILDQKGDLFRAFGVAGLPFTVLVDRIGTIRFIHLGFARKDLDGYRKEITLLLEENLNP